MLRWQVNDMVEGREWAQRLRQGGLRGCQVRSGVADDPAEGSFQTPTSKSTCAVGPVAVTTGWCDVAPKTQSKGSGPGLSGCPSRGPFLDLGHTPGLFSSGQDPHKHKQHVHSPHPCVGNPLWKRPRRTAWPLVLGSKSPWVSSWLIQGGLCDLPLTAAVTGQQEGLKETQGNEPFVTEGTGQSCVRLVAQVPHFPPR